MAVELGRDMWEEILRYVSSATAHRVRGVSKDLQAVADACLGGLITRFGAHTANQNEIQVLFCLSADEARGLPHQVVPLSKYYCHRFDVAEVDRLVRVQFGTSVIQRRLASRLQRKRKREASVDDLAERKSKAAATRRRSLDRALSNANLAPSVDAWAAALEERTGGLLRPLVPPYCRSAHEDFFSPDDPTFAILRRYLSSDALKPPDASMAEALRAVRDLEARFSAQRISEWLAREAREKLAAQERRRELEAALGTLGVSFREDSRLCCSFVAGDPVHGFETAARVADQMAYMRWLHRNREYTRAIEREVTFLADCEGYHFAGIYHEATRRVQSLPCFQRPATWPWLAPTTP